MLSDIATGSPLEPDFRSAWQIAQVVDAILLSSTERRWVKPAEV